MTLAEGGDGPTVAEETEESIDGDVIESLRELGGSEMLSELTQLFFEDTRSSMATLRKALEEGDAQSVERVAHNLKGSCDSMGATRMAAICAELQDVGTSANLSRGPELLEHLKAEFERVRPALETEVARSQD